MSNPRKKKSNKSYRNHSTIKKKYSYDQNNFECVSQSDDDSVYLLDTNILSGILKDGESFLEKIKLHANGKQITFLLLDRIMIEFHNMRKLNNTNDSNPVKVKSVKIKLQEYGKIVEDNFTEKQREWAKQFELKKHMNDRGIPLSTVDCMFLKYVLDNPHIVVVTHDKLLRDVIFEQNSTVRTFDPYLLQIH